jgi:hypothetical protein
MTYALYANTDTGRPTGQAYVGGERDARGPNALTTGAWTHLAAGYDGSTVRLYVNGVQAASTPASGPMTVSTGPLDLGGNGIWGEWFAGLIDDVRVYNRPLSQSQLQADMATAVPGRPAPVAAFSFNEGSGSTVHDASGRGNDGTTANTGWAAGKFGGALSFNGTSSWVTVADSPSLDLTTAMTLEAWVNPNALGTTWRTVLFKTTTGGMVYSLYANQDGTRPVGQVSIGGEQEAVGAAALPLNAWSHLAATFDGSSLRLYVNGALAGTTAVSGTIPASTDALRIGGNSVWPEWFSGLIDDVRVYDRALTPSEIQADMATPVG